MEEWECFSYPNFAAMVVALDLISSIVNAYFYNIPYGISSISMISLLPGICLISAGEPDSKVYYPGTRK